jgi:hypothetical protein
MKPVRVEQPPMRCGYSGPRTAMDEQNGPTIGATDLFEMNLVKTTIKLATTKRRLYRKQLFFLNECVRHFASISHKCGA